MLKKQIDKSLTHDVGVKTRPLKHLQERSPKILLLQQMKRWLRIIIQWCVLIDLGYQFTTSRKDFWQHFCEHCQSDLQSD